MQNLFGLTQNHVANQRGLLLPGVVTQGFNQCGLAVGKTELDEVLTDQARVGVHGDEPLQKAVAERKTPAPEGTRESHGRGCDARVHSGGSWVDAWEAALEGLHQSLCGVICLGKAGGASEAEDGTGQPIAGSGDSGSQRTMCGMEAGGRDSNSFSIASIRSSCVMSGLLGFRGGEGGPVDVFKCQSVAERGGIGNQALRGVGENGLAAFVVAYIALGAANAICHGGLRYAQPVSDHSDIAHGDILAQLLFLSIEALFLCTTSGTNNLSYD